MIAEVAARLQPHAAQLAERWRCRPAGLPRPAGPAIGRLMLEGGLPLLASRNFAAYAESVDYTARRLAKLRVPLYAIGAGLRAQVAVAEPLLAGCFGARTRDAAAALEQFQQSVFLRVVRAYDEVQRGALEALLGVLDAELEARDLHDLLMRLLTRAAHAFSARWGGLLLARADGRLEHAALFGVDRRCVFADAPAGIFFREVMTRARPGFLLDAANDPRVGQPYFRALDIKGLWAAPLVGRWDRRTAPPARGQSFGLLHLDFDRAYECLPQERDLLLAFARRSSLAIERARLLESLAASNARVRRLSRELLRAQENERRRISRDLHDAAGQVMMATRLHLEMARRYTAGGPAGHSLAEALASVDAGIRELRRIIRDLTPLGLGGGLAAAVRRQAAEFERTREIPVQLLLRLPRRPPRELETLAFRWVQEALTNVARHAQAHRVQLAVVAGHESLHLRITDDGRGLCPGHREMAEGASGTVEDGFGLTAMRERVELAGGALRILPTPGGGVTLEAEIPWPRGGAEPPLPPDSGPAMALAAHA